MSSRKEREAGQHATVSSAPSPSPPPQRMAYGTKSRQDTRHPGDWCAPACLRDPKRGEAGHGKGSSRSIRGKRKKEEEWLHLGAVLGPMVGGYQPLHLPNQSIL